MTRRFATAAAGLWIAALMLTVTIATQSGTPTADISIARTLHEFALQNLWLADTARLFSLLGSGIVVAPLTVALVLVLFLRGHSWWAIWLGSLGLGGVLISQTVKRTVDRPRPVWPDPLHELTTPSFPSGHAMVGIYAYVAFGMVAWFLLRRPWNGAVAAVLVVFGVLMGPSRVAFGVHWPSDVLAGWCYAAAWMCTVTALLLWRLGPPRRSQAAQRTEVPDEGRV